MMIGPIDAAVVDARQLATTPTVTAQAREVGWRSRCRAGFRQSETGRLCSQLRRVVY